MTEPLPVPALDALPDLPWKEKLAYLIFKFHEAPQVECPLEHVFEAGLYIRRIAIPKGTLFIGRPHRVGHMVDLLSGSVLHVTERCRRIVHAPFSMTTTPQYQVCALALTDITARTVHPDCGMREVEALEKHWFESIESLKELGQEIDQQMRKCIYERDSSSSSGSGGGRSGWLGYCGI
jgi:hypothetical protein